LSINFFDEVNNNGNNDEQAGTSDGYGTDTGEGFYKQRQDGDNTQKERPNHGDTEKSFSDVSGSGNTRADARDESAASLQIFGHGIGIKSDGGVKICENKNQQEIHYSVKSLICQNRKNKRRNFLDYGIASINQKFHYHLREKKD